MRPASRGPLPKRPCTERVDAPLPARRSTEAYPLRYGEGGQRSRSAAVRVHRTLSDEAKTPSEAAERVKAPQSGPFATKRAGLL